MNDPRFMTEKCFEPKRCFDHELLDLARSCAHDLKENPRIKALPALKEIQKYLFEGSYFWLTGPTYETKVECKFLVHLGMDAVGMSTVPDFLSAAATGVRTLGIAMVTDTMDRTEPLTHHQVLENAARAVPVLSELLLDIITKVQLSPERKAEIENRLHDSSEKIQEYLLVHPRELGSPTIEDVQKAATMVKTLMKQMGVEKIDHCYVFLNRMKYSTLIQYMDSCSQIKLSKLEGKARNFLGFTYAGRNGVLAVGTMPNGDTCLSVCNADVEGFYNVEGYFLTKILQEVGVKMAYVIVEAWWLCDTESTVVPVRDYFYRGFVSPVNPGVQLTCGYSEKLRINDAIRRIHPSYQPDPILFGFEGPIKPTQAEKLCALSLRCNIYSLCSLSIINSMDSEGLLAPIIAEVNCTNHDELLKLLFKGKYFLK